MRPTPDATRHLVLLTTGGTIEKTYDEHSGTLTNRGPIVTRMLSRLKLVGTDIAIRELMSKDSLHMTEMDRDQIVAAVRTVTGPLENTTGVVILHGTDTLCVTGDRLHQNLFAGPNAASPRVPIILTGAMRPFEMKRSDALQNLTEALLAASLMPPGVYVAAHGRVLTFPGIVKNRERGTFERGPAARA
jgi:L-asparaginase